MESIFNHSEQQKPTVSVWDRVGDLLQELNGGILLCTSAYDPAIASCDGIMGAPPHPVLPSNCIGLEAQLLCLVLTVTKKMSLQVTRTQVRNSLARQNNVCTEIENVEPVPLTLTCVTW